MPLLVPNHIVSPVRPIGHRILVYLGARRTCSIDVIDATPDLPLAGLDEVEVSHLALAHR
jgi:hypothetical protein